MFKKTSWILAAPMTFLIGVLFVTLFVLEKSDLAPKDLEKIVSVESVNEITKQQIEEEKYRIYSALIKDSQTSQNFSLFVKNSKHLVIGKETIACGKDNEEYGEKVEDLRKSIENYGVSSLKISIELLNDYHLRNEKCARLDEKFDIPVKYVLATDKELEAIFSNDVIDGWNRFYKEFPDSSGLINFSNVGFSRDGEQAFLYVIRSCGGLCGAGYYVLLKKKNAVWEVIGARNVWVS